MFYAELVCLLLAFHGAADDAAYNDLIRASVYIEVKGPKEKCNNCSQDHYKWVIHGSGTIISSFAHGDKYYSYVLTASHLFNDSQNFVVEVFNDEEELFGSYKGEVRLKSKSNTQTDQGEPDLALVGFESDKQLPFIPIAPEDYKISVGDVVFQVGCPGGEVPPKPLAKKLRVKAINQRAGAGTIECTRAPAQGRSGGGLFNAAKELIGVCSLTDREERRGIYSSLAEIYKFLKNTEFEWLLRLVKKNASDKKSEANYNKQPSPKFCSNPRGVKAFLI